MADEVGERPVEDIRGPITLGWRRLGPNPGHAYGRVIRLSETVIFEGWEVVAGPADGWAVRFRLVVGPNFVARALEAEADGPRGLRRVSVRRSPKGLWWVDGKRRPDLDPCLDIDVAATPLTNTPTIRRLALDVGQSAELAVAWVDVPSLAVTPESQGYDRLTDAGEQRRYRFRAGGIHGLVLTADADGLVRDYEDFAKRAFRR
jgi:uncharacterized protein